MRKSYVLIATESDIEQLSVSVKEAVRHIQVNIIGHFVKSQKKMMVATEGSVTYPVVVVKVSNITCIASLDTGAGSSY